MGLGTAWLQGLGVSRQQGQQEAQEKAPRCSPGVLTAWGCSGGSRHGSTVAAPAWERYQIHVTFSLLAGKTLWKKQKLHWILF